MKSLTTATIEEFETRWAEMLVKHDVADSAHLQDVYDLRENFVPVYFKHRFFPFLQTTARSEGFNAVLKKYVKPHDSLLRFFKQYMKLQEQIEVAEDHNEFLDEDKTVKVWGDYPMEHRAADAEHIHTPHIRPFQARDAEDNILQCS